MEHAEYRYAHARSNTHVVQPWAFFMFVYQLPVFFPGYVFFLVVVGGLVLLIRRWRRGGVAAGLAWGVGIVNLVVPIAAHELDYRYALSAVPFACLALGLVCVRRPRAVVASVAPGAGAAPAPAAASAPAGDPGELASSGERPSGDELPASTEAGPETEAG
jgi:hypothetical protein